MLCMMGSFQPLIDLVVIREVVTYPVEFKATHPDPMTLLMICLGRQLACEDYCPLVEFGKTCKRLSEVRKDLLKDRLLIIVERDFY